MQTVNLFDSTAKRYITVRPTIRHEAPDGTLMCFEAFDERAKDMHHLQLFLQGFKVVCHAGFIVAARFSVGTPRGLYKTIPLMQRMLFSQFNEVVVSTPERLKPHPLVHVVPDGLPGAGIILVYNVAELKAGEPPRKGLSFVEKEAAARASARQVMRDLGWELAP